jgi:hypothetical protein
MYAPTFSPARQSTHHLELKGRSFAIGCSVNPFLLLSLLVALAGSVCAQNHVSDEDRSRFVERSYKKAEPGLRAPADYIAIAKKAAHDRYGSEIMFKDYSDGIVTYRTYRNAPKADREIICVAFIYQQVYSGGGYVGGGTYYLRADPPTPVVLVLMRRDLSKIYVNIVHYKRVF